MKNALLMLASAAAIVLGSGVADAPRSAARTARDPDAAITDPVIREFVHLVNQRRVAKGCPPLIWSQRLAAVAEAHSRDMATRGFFSHTNPDGASPFDRLEDAWVRYYQAAENIAAGHRTAESVFQGWLASPKHRANLEDCNLTHHGVGRYENRWTHVLVRPAPGADL
jgi:uncharacterized protein YkwD